MADTNLNDYVVFNVGTKELKDIITILNKKPFDENFTLFSFDELTNDQRLSLFSKVLKSLDELNTIDFNSVQKEETELKLIEFFEILGYPNINEDFGKNIINCDKSLTNSLFYFMLKGHSEVKMRAYLGKYLVPIRVKAEYLGDDEIKRLQDQNNELIAEFQEAHFKIEELNKLNENPTELQKILDQLEQEKEQLSNKIKTFKQKNTETPEFLELLASISKLRKEQDEYGNLCNKLQLESDTIEKIEEEILLSQQELIDAKRSFGAETSANTILERLKQALSQTKANISKINIEKKEKMRKLNENEVKLNEPVPTYDEIKDMEHKVGLLRAQINDMESKLENEKDKGRDDLLSINKQMAQKVLKRKEQVLQEVSKLEQEDEKLNLKLRDMKEAVGGREAGADELKKFSLAIAEKSKLKKEKVDELALLEYELTILSRTEKLLTNKFKLTQKELSEFEEKYGITGMLNMEEEIEKLTEQKGNLDIAKGKSLEEMSKLITQLNIKIQEKQSSLEPLLEENKIVKNEYKQIEDIYLSKKDEYDRALNYLFSSISQLEKDNFENKSKYQELINKTQVLKEKKKILEQFIKILNNEKEYKSGSKSLSSSHKSYNDLFNSIIQNNEKKIFEYKKEREEIKDKINNNSKTRINVKELLDLLNIKLDHKMNNGMLGEELKGTVHKEGDINRVVI